MQFNMTFSSYIKLKHMPRKNYYLMMVFIAIYISLLSNIHIKKMFKDFMSSSNIYKLD